MRCARKPDNRSTDKREKILQLVKRGKNRIEISEIIGCSYATVCNYVREMEDDKNLIVKNLPMGAASGVADEVKVMCRMWDNSSPLVREVFLKVIGARLANEEQYA